MLKYYCVAYSEPGYADDEFDLFFCMARNSATAEEQCQEEYPKATIVQTQRVPKHDWPQEEEEETKVRKKRTVKDWIQIVMAVLFLLLFLVIAGFVTMAYFRLTS